MSDLFASFLICFYVYDIKNTLFYIRINDAKKHNINISIFFIKRAEVVFIS